MPRATTNIVTIAVCAGAVCAGLLTAGPARAEPARAALVVGNATYASLPGIPGCARSANIVSAALRGLGFQVTEREDATTGGIDAGIAEFSQRLAAGKGPGFIYVCGYGTDYNDRTFLLPTSASIARPSDVLTQGVLAKTMLTTVSRDPDTVALVVFDLSPKPDAPPAINLDALVGVPVPQGVGVLAVTETALPDKPTPLAAALTAALVGPVVRTDGLLGAVKARLGGGTAGLMAAHGPARPGDLVGPPPSEPKPAAVPATLPATPAPVASAAPPAPATTTGAVPATRPTTATAPMGVVRERLPDEADMTEANRRTVQGSLARLGYYELSLDGVFGPETRAAIRRYQHEIGAEMTGRLTGDQATRLIETK